MSGNTFGTIFKVTTFGESHGPALGCIVDGCPAGIPIDITRIQEALNRRKPGAKQFDSEGKEIFNAAVTARKENDKAEILSGIFVDPLNEPNSIPLSTGTPITILIRNTSQHSKDYSNIKDVFRPGHADYTYQQKYGIRDYFGGGRSSGRETAARVAAGAIAQIVLENISSPQLPQIVAWTQEAAGIRAPEFFSPNEQTTISSTNSDSTTDHNLQKLCSIINTNTIRAPDTDSAQKMIKAISECRKNGNSAGGIIRCVAIGFPAGLGEPVFDKLDAELAKAMLSIGAIKGIEFGSGFDSANMLGSEWNDVIRINDDNRCSPIFETNHAGGILGGLSTGSPITFDVVVKPVPSIFLQQKTIKQTAQNNTYENTEIKIEGRHDVCLCPRIVPVVEAMTAIVLADMLLRNHTARS
jgi:chorismate synthase